MVYVDNGKMEPNLEEKVGGVAESIGDNMKE